MDKELLNIEKKLTDLKVESYLDQLKPHVMVISEILQNFQIKSSAKDGNEILVDLREIVGNAFKSNRSAISGEVLTVWLTFALNAFEKFFTIPEVREICRVEAVDEFLKQFSQVTNTIDQLREEPQEDEE